MATDFRSYFAGADRDWDTDPEGTVRLAVVGLGGFARNVALPAIAAGEYCEPTVVVSGSPDTAAEVAAEHDAEAIDYAGYAAGAATDAYDAVYIATPNALHLPHAETAAEYGKHVICEKPLEADVERAERLVTACEDAGVTLMTAYRMQTDPVLRRLRSFVADGGLGTVTKLHGDFTYPVMGGDRGPEQWRLDADLAGGGALPDVGIYPLNTARFLLGADPIATSAVTAGEGAFEAVDEHVTLLVEFPDDVAGAFTASFTGPTDTHLTAYGTDGHARVDSAFEPGADRTLRVTTEEGSATVEGIGRDEVREEFDYFAHAVLTGTRPDPDGRDGLVDMRVMAAAYEAAETGRRIAVDA